MSFNIAVKEQIYLVCLQGGLYMNPSEQKGEHNLSFVYDWHYKWRASFLNCENQQKNKECKLC